MDYSFAWYLYPIIIIVGFIAGYINTLAGNGSLLTLPLLIFLGLPVGVANGTNRVAVVLQAMVATGSFRQQKLMSIRHCLLLAIPAVLAYFVRKRCKLKITLIVINHKYIFLNLSFL